MSDDDGKKKKKDDHPTPEGKVKVVRTQTTFEDAHPKKKTSWFPTFSGPANWPQAVFGIVVVVALLVLFAPAVNRMFKTSANSTSQKDHKSILNGFLKTPDQSLSPYDKNGGKSGRTPDIFARQGQSPGAAPDPFTKGITGSYTNAACKGGKRSTTLVAGSKPYLVDQYNACRVPFYVPPGALIEAMDEHGAWYRLQPGSTREVLAVRAVAATVNFSYTRCSKESPAGMLNWDCTLLTQYASQ